MWGMFQTRMPNCPLVRGKDLRKWGNETGNACGLHLHACGQAISEDQNGRLLHESPVNLAIPTDYRHKASAIVSDNTLILTYFTPPDPIISGASGAGTHPPARDILSNFFLSLSEIFILERMWNQ